VGGWGDCIVAGVEANDKFVVAVSTMFIAIFTFTLWWSTKRLGYFAARQAEETEESLHIARKAVEAAQIPLVPAKSSPTPQSETATVHGRPCGLPLRSPPQVPPEA
jgi:hypothetical protein